MAAITLLGARRRRRKARKGGVRCKAKYGWRKNASGTKCVRVRGKRRKARRARRRR